MCFELLCFYFYLSVKITIENSKTGTSKALKLLLFEFYTQSGVKFPL
jgi:hypothetical protein